MHVRPYAPADRPAWDAFVEEAINATFLHARDHLDRPSARARDASLLLEDRRGRLVGVLPAARHPSDPGTVESHPAVGYGGLLHAGALGGTAMQSALAVVAEQLYHDGHDLLRYKLTPPMHHRVASQDDVFALHRLGAVRSRCDLASVVDVGRRPPVAARRRRGRRSADRAGVRFVAGLEQLPRLWPVLTGRLAELGATPAHGLDELRGLAARFPGGVDCAVGEVDGRVAGGVVLFRTPQVTQAQYIGSDEAGRRTAVLDLVFAELLERCTTRWFSFGNSTVGGGREFHEGQFAFKQGFGAGTIAFEAYDLPLR